MISLPQRQQIVQWVDEASVAGARRHKACELLGITARALQRWRQSGWVGERWPYKSRVRAPGNKLSDAEREQSISGGQLGAEFARFAAQPDRTDIGRAGRVYSLGVDVLSGAARCQATSSTARPAVARTVPHKPEALQATAPNQLYSWDITYLPSSVRGVFFYLYLFMDLYSRKIVGWQVYEQESSEWAAEIVRDIVLREGIAPAIR